METAVWIGIALCLAQSGMFSGLNLATLGVSRLRLEIEAEGGDPAAATVLELRKNSNLLLVTVLWGNVAVNCLLTLLTESVMAGFIAFFVSTFSITFFGEILPQAYFSRNAIRMGSLLAPFIRFYQKLLYPVVQPSAKLLDWWLGPEGIPYFRERDLRQVIKKHMYAPDADITHSEGLGALNFLTLDDVPIHDEGEPVHPDSVIQLPLNVDLPVIPDFAADSSDPFIRSVNESGKKWVVLTDPAGAPRLVLEADGFLRRVLFGKAKVNPYTFCHRPIVVEDRHTEIGTLLRQLRVHAVDDHDDVIDQDLILLWAEEKRVLTGADLLGRLLRGIAQRDPPSKPS